MSGNKQQLGIIMLFLLLASAPLGACSGASAKEATRMPTLTAARLASPMLEPTPAASPIVTPSLTPSPTTAASPKALPLSSPKTDFPLALNDTWVFQTTKYVGFNPSEIMTTTYVITETIVDVKSTSSYFIAQVHQDQNAEMPVDVPKSMQGIPLPPAISSDYWLVLNGNRLYRQEYKLDLANLSTALLEFVFPLKLGAKWYQTDELVKSNPTYADPWMLRKVTKVGTVVVPAGRFTNCFFLQEVWAGTTFETWFCSNVGIVDRKADHHGTPEGFRQVLTTYQLQK